MMMRFQTKLILLMGGIALFVLLCILGMTLLHLKHTTDQVKELGKEYTVGVLQHRAEYTVHVFRGLIESDFHRLARIRLSADCPKALPERINAAAFAPTAKENNKTEFTCGIYRDGDSVKYFTAEQLRKLNHRLLENEDGTDSAHNGDIHFIMLEGDIWIHTVRENGCFLLRFDREELQTQIYQNTLTHCILLDQQGRVLLATGKEDPAVMLNIPEVQNLLKMADNDRNNVYTLELPRRFCAAVNLDFPDIGMRNITVFRMYDILTSAPDVTDRIDERLAEFYGFFLLLMGVSVAAMLVPIFLFARRVAKPVVRAVDFANTLADGAFPEPLPPDNSGIVETAMLHQSLNRMRVRLCSMIEKLQRSHAREQKERRYVESTSVQKTEFVLAIANSLSNIIDKIEQKELASRLRHCEDLLQDLAELDTENAPHSARLDAFAFFRNEAAPFADRLEFHYGSNMPQFIFTDRDKLHDLFVRILVPVMEHAVCRLVMSLGQTQDGDAVFFRLEGSGGNQALQNYLNHAAGGTAAHGLDTDMAEKIILLTLAKRSAHLLGGEMDIQCRDDGTYRIEVSFPQDTITES